MEHAQGPILTNLAKACGKQDRPREAALLASLAEYFDEPTGAENPGAWSELAALLGEDDAKFIAPIRNSAAAHADRGALRMAAWAGKVQAIQKSVTDRYLKKGEDLLEGKSIFVCEACGFIFIGDEAPDICPVCKAPALRFQKIA